MRWLWLKRTDDVRPWQHLPDKEERVVKEMFQASIYIELGDGNKALFWTDHWFQGQSLLDVAPCLCDAVGSRIQKQRTVAQALQGDRWVRDIKGALTVQVIIEYLRVWDMTREIQLVVDREDRICWKWSADKVFSTSSAYSSFFIGQLLTQNCAKHTRVR